MLHGIHRKRADGIDAELIQIRALNVGYWGHFVTSSSEATLPSRRRCRSAWLNSEARYVSTKSQATIGPVSASRVLLGYLDTAAVDGIWRRFARTLSGFASGRYISDLHLGSVQNAQIRAFRTALSVFVRGQVHLHFDNAQQAEGALRDAGFAWAKLYSAADVPGTEPSGDRGGRLAHILEASTR